MRNRRKEGLCRKGKLHRPSFFTKRFSYHYDIIEQRKKNIRRETRKDQKEG